MKSPSKNVSASLREQRPGGVEGGEDIRVSREGRYTRIPPPVPGEAGSQRPPGARAARSAAHYVEPMSRFGGRGSD